MDHFITAFIVTKKQPQKDERHSFYTLPLQINSLLCKTSSSIHNDLLYNNANLNHIEDCTLKMCWASIHCHYQFEKWTRKRVIKSGTNLIMASPLIKVIHIEININNYNLYDSEYVQSLAIFFSFGQLNPVAVCRGNKSFFSTEHEKKHGNFFETKIGRQL